MNLLASKIRNGRIALGYSQGYVSKKLNISQQTYSLLENDPSRLTIQRFIKLCRILKISATEIMEQIEMEYPIEGVETTKNSEAREREQLNRQLQLMQMSLTKLKTKLDELHLEKYDNSRSENGQNTDEG